MKGGIRLLGFGTVAAGVLDLIYGEFEAAHQPIQAVSDRLAAMHWLAYLAGVALIAAGLALQWPRTRRAGAIATAVLYACFAAFWIPRFWIVPRMIGMSAHLMLGLIAGPCVQLVPMIAALIVYARTPRVAAIARPVIAVCAIFFGIEHLINPTDVATMIPAWMPLGGTLWSIVTGIAFELAGIAIALGGSIMAERKLDVLAARLLALMFLVFSALSLLPIVIDSPRDHTSWGGNVVNLAIIGSVWLFADLLDDDALR